MIASASLTLCGVAFALSLYPPFQVPLVYVGLALIPLLVSGVRNHTRSSWLVRWLSVGVAVTIGAAVIVLFVLENTDAVDRMSATVYPGARLSLGGEMTLVKYFSGFFDIFFRQDLFPARFGSMSETSSFIVLWPLAALCVPGIVSRKERWRCIPLVVFLVLTTAWAFCGVPMWLAAPSGWSFVPTYRGVIGWGLGGVFLCVATMARMPRMSRRYKMALSGVAIVMIGGFTAWYRSRVELEVSVLRYIYAALVTMALATALVWNARGVMVALICIACLIPNALVNPLMRGVSVLTDSMLARAVQRFDVKKEGSWIVVGEPRYAQVVKATGKKVINGSQYIPELAIWRAIDSDGVSAAIYNRYAHIAVRFGETGTPPHFQLVAPDAWQLTIDPCGGALRAIGANYLAWIDYDAAAKFACLERLYVEKNIAVYKLRSHTRAFASLP